MGDEGPRYEYRSDGVHVKERLTSGGRHVAEVDAEALTRWGAEEIAARIASALTSCNFLPQTALDAGIVPAMKTVLEAYAEYDDHADECDQCSGGEYCEEGSDLYETAQRKRRQVEAWMQGKVPAVPTGPFKQMTVDEVFAAGAPEPGEAPTEEEK